MNIEQLLENFYEGVSTPEEEQILKDFFLREDTADGRWETERQLFRLLDGEMQMPAGLSGRLAESIRQMDRAPHAPARRQIWFRRIAAVAAVALIGVALYFTTREPAQPVLADTFSDPEEAAVAAGKTLVFISEQLNNGLNRIAIAGQEMEKANQIVNKHFKR
jgi:hypothetical protein